MAIPAADTTIIAVASGAGSPGRTTVATNLAVALGAIAPTILLEVDVNPGVAAALRLQPEKNLYMLSQRPLATRAAWHRALEKELQPYRKQLAILCSFQTGTMRGGVTPTFLREVLAVLADFGRFIVIDVGADLIGVELHRAAVSVADEVLLVGSPTASGLVRWKEARKLVTGALGLDLRRVHFVLNGWDARHHDDWPWIEYALGGDVNRPLATVIPYDHAAAARADLVQEPLIGARGAAATALRELAGKIARREIERGRDRDDTALPGQGSSRRAPGRRRPTEAPLPAGTHRREWRGDLATAFMELGTRSQLASSIMFSYSPRSAG